ncbi:MAG: cyclic lactone autoinducer peptide [Lachnospiraceae bacterium]|nr:cyclic lactone autoinducer peptide [Lachnospiraceae bacterium]
MRKGVVKMVLKKVAYHEAEKSAKIICGWFFYQPKLPNAVKKLRKF